MNTHDAPSLSIDKGPLKVRLRSVFMSRFSYPAWRYMPERPPLRDVARAREVDYPFRHSVSWAYRVPFTREAFVVGWWLPAGRTDEPYEVVERRELHEALNPPHQRSTKGALARAWDAVAIVAHAVARRTGLINVQRGVQALAGPSVLPWRPSRLRVVAVEQEGSNSYLGANATWAQADRGTDYLDRLDNEALDLEEARAAVEPFRTSPAARARFTTRADELGVRRKVEDHPDDSTSEPWDGL
jgi:hypothetical protein